MATIVVLLLVSNRSVLTILMMMISVGRIDIVAATVVPFVRTRQGAVSANSAVSRCWAVIGET